MFNISLHGKDVQNVRYLRYLVGFPENRLSTLLSAKLSRDVLKFYVTKEDI